MPAARAKLSELTAMIRAVERHAEAGQAEATAALPTGWPAVDAVLGGLVRGAVHEWCGVSAEAGEQMKSVEPSRGAPSARRGRRGSRSDWTPPLCILTHLAWQALGPAPAPITHGPPRKRKRFDPAAGPCVVWVGRRCWPYPRLLVRGAADNRHPTPENQRPAPFPDTRLLARSLFIDPPDRAARVWAIELALRSPAVALVIADGSGLDIAATRRLQLAAEATNESGSGGEARSSSGIALLARPPDEARELSVAATRWRVSCAPAAPSRKPLDAAAAVGVLETQASPFSGGRDGARSAAALVDALRRMETRVGPRWRIELLRCKGAAAAASVEAASQAMQVASQGVGWTLEWRHEKGVITVPPDVVDRPGAPPAAAGAASLVIDRRTA